MSQVGTKVELPPIGAIISDNKKYRWRLWRPAADQGVGTCLFIMLNPSTADGTTDDPTIRRCVGYATRWGYAELDVVNLYGYRATDPSALWKVDDPVGAENDGWIRESALMSSLIVCAWGVNAGAERATAVVRMLLKDNLELHHLGLTGSGQPKHPLRLRADLKPERWVPTCDACNVPGPHTHCPECGAYDHTADRCDNLG